MQDFENQNGFGDNKEFEVMPDPRRKKRRIIIAAVIAVSIVLIGIAAVLVFLFSGKFKQVTQEVQSVTREQESIVERPEYTVVLVHGMGGWGEGAGVADAQYWGASTGNLPDYLREEGYLVCAPTVGPFSSTWDRACELYAQLAGTTVDYGEAHAKAHGHARYGRTYDTPLVADWGQKKSGGQIVKVHLIGHSFGGETVRMLASLLAYGDASEREATGGRTSTLFKGGHADWVFSVTTLCSPHNGSQLTCMVDEIGAAAGFDNMTDLLVDVIFRALQQNKEVASVTDLMLDQFGIYASDDDKDVSDALDQIQSAGTDHAFYDLSPDGAAELNTHIRTVEGIYYFSYAYSTTKPGSMLKGMVPESNTMPILYPLALALGGYTGTTPGGIEIDESWQDNDGLVSVVSAQYPAGEPNAQYSGEEADLRTGVWYVLPTMSGDHGTPIGMNTTTQATHQLFTDMIARVEDLRE